MFDNKVLMVGALSLVTGGVIGYLYGTTVAEKRHQEYIDKELEEDRNRLSEVIESYQEMLDDKKKAVSKKGIKPRVVDEPFEETPVIVEETPDTLLYEEIVNEYTGMTEVRVNGETRQTFPPTIKKMVPDGDGNMIEVEEFDMRYAHDPEDDEFDDAIILGENEDDIEEEDDDDDDDEFVPKYTHDQWRVSVISPDDYRIGEADQIKEEFTYYEKDDVLVDSDNIPVEEEDLFGDFESNFGLYGAPNNVVHIRNREIGVDARITKTDKSFNKFNDRSARGKSKKMRKEYDD